jgi:glycosyltransferase involved in cell wall biosynthesis
LGRIYASHDVLLFPALHESGGLAALEAMRHGLPVVCLKLGGPATLVDEECGRLIDPENKSAAQVAFELGTALVQLSEPCARGPLAEAARRRGVMFRWDEKVKRVYGMGNGPPHRTSALSETRA